MAVQDLMDTLTAYAEVVGYLPKSPTFLPEPGDGCVLSGIDLRVRMGMFEEEPTPLWLAGLFWAVWHYPVTAYITLSQMVAVPMVGMVFIIIYSLAGQTMTLIGMTYIYAWLCNNTKSVFIPILFHALGNMISTVLIVDEQPLLTTMSALMPWAIVIILQRVYGRERFPGKPSP